MKICQVEDPWRKHHQSAVTHNIWWYNLKEATHSQLTHFEGEDRNPVWASGEESFFIF